jgi:nucleotide-binding universal stress UspA family protein
VLKNLGEKEIMDEPSRFAPIFRWDKRTPRMKATLSNILFPVDFSNRCVLAAPYVKAWADCFGAVLNTLHIVNEKAVGSDWNGEFNCDDLSDLIAKRTADLKYFSDHYFGENVAQHTVLSGDTADQIEYFAKREKVDLIMFPRAHHNILSRIQRDSLTATLLERSSASVWTTGHVEALDPSVNSILCAVHFESDVTLDCENHRILQVVRDLATSFRAKVRFLRVIDRQEQATAEASEERSILAGAEPWLVQMRQDLGNSAEYVSKSGNVLRRSAIQRSR